MNVIVATSVRFHGSPSFVVRQKDGPVCPLTVRVTTVRPVFFTIYGVGVGRCH